MSAGGIENNPADRIPACNHSASRGRFAAAVLHVPGVHQRLTRRANNARVMKAGAPAPSCCTLPARPTPAVAGRSPWPALLGGSAFVHRDHLLVARAECRAPQCLEAGLSQCACRLAVPVGQVGGRSCAVVGAPGRKPTASCAAALHEQRQTRCRNWRMAVAGIHQPPGDPLDRLWRNRFGPNIWVTSSVESMKRRAGPELFGARRVYQQQREGEAH